MPDIYLEALEDALGTDQINLNVDRFQVLDDAIRTDLINLTQGQTEAGKNAWFTLDNLGTEPTDEHPSGARAAYDTRAAAVPLERARREAVLSRFDFAAAAAQAEFVTFAEAAQWAAGNALPALVQGVIDALPSEEQGPAMLDALARPNIRRNGALMPALAAAFSTNDAGLDALFGIA